MLGTRYFGYAGIAVRVGHVDLICWVLVLSGFLQFFGNDRQFRLPYTHSARFPFSGFARAAAPEHGRLN